MNFKNAQRPEKESKVQKGLRFKENQGKVIQLVLIKWLLEGNHLEEKVPISIARHRRSELEAQGAVVYWSERVLASN